MDVDRIMAMDITDFYAKRLQWSHVLMDVDSGVAYEAPAVDTLASMEPRPDGRG